MHTLVGQFFDGKTAAARPAELRIDPAGNARFEPAGIAPALHIRDIRIADRIAGLPAALLLPGGARFETPDHDTLALCLEAAGLRNDLLHRLERHRTIALGAAVALLAFAAAVYFQGLPLAGRILAPLVPQPVVAALGDGVLEQLDRIVFSPSQLSYARRAELLEQFNAVADGIDSPVRPKLVFRNGGWIDANAFALPDGTIVMTDQLVQIARDDAQILAVELHEIGHLANRHALRQIIQRSGIGLIALMVFGDVSAVGSVLTALPAILLETAFSRDMEREADDFAATQMRELDVPIESFTGFFTRMERYYRSCHDARGPAGEDEPEPPAPDRRRLRDVILGGEEPPPAPPMDVAAVRACLDSGADTSARSAAASASGWIGYLSTHPATAERIERLLGR